MAKSTPQELAEKKQRQALLSLCNSISSAFSFKQIKTWRDVYFKKGESEDYINKTYSADDLNKLVTFADLKAYFETLKQQQEVRILAARAEAAADEVKEAAAKEELAPTIQKLVEPEANDESGIHNKENYGLPAFPELEKVIFLFWFQKKAVKEALDKLLGFDVAMCHTVAELKTEYQKRGSQGGNLRGILLLSSTGTGKTYMVAALVKYLHYIGFTTDKTIGSVEYLYVTRSSIVEQTRRVFATFGLLQNEGVEVLNIEQLRSRGGELWLREQSTIVNGEEQFFWEWRKAVYPVVLLLDECQAVKNEGSTQSQIIQAFAEIKTHDTYTVFISATPFTKVSEAKSFVINCHMEDDTIL